MWKRDSGCYLRCTLIRIMWELFLWLSILHSRPGTSLMSLTLESLSICFSPCPMLICECSISFLEFTLLGQLPISSLCDGCGYGDSGSFNSLTSHLRCTLIVSVWSVLELCRNDVSILHPRPVTSPMFTCPGISLHPCACPMVIFLNSTIRSAAYQFYASWFDCG